MENIKVFNYLRFLVKHKATPWMLLIILLGGTLRCYNLDFPSIGYHNMKENEYLSMAEIMSSSGDYLTRRVYFYNAFDKDPKMTLYPQPPMVSYQTLISWHIFGHNLWGPRLFNVLFGLGSILIIYGIAYLFFESLFLSLLAAFLLAIMPLAVFFSRNLQPESPALFFMLLGSLFYLKFAKSLNLKYLFWGGIAFFLTWLYKFSFLIGIIPCFFCFPFRKLIREKESIFLRLFKFIFPYFLIFIFILIIYLMGQWYFDPKETTDRISLSSIFFPDYWKVNAREIWLYISRENFTVPLSVTAMLGVLIAFIKRRGILNRYIIGWTLSIIIYSMIFSDYINQHNYYQMPFLGMFCLAIVWALVNIDSLLRKFIKKNFLIYLVAIIMGFSTPPIFRAYLSLYGTNFWGVDVAGESIKSLTKPGERFFLLARVEGQSVAKFAQRYGGWAKSPQDFLEKEDKFKIKYICIYPVSFLRRLENYPNLLRYIRHYYHPKEIGLIKETNRYVYIILERRDVFDYKNEFDYVTLELKPAMVYKLFGNDLSFYTLRYNFTDKINPKNK